MKITKNYAATLLLLGAVATIIPGCKKSEGCTDPAALNYDADADKDCCCEYATTKQFVATDLGNGVTMVSGETDVNFTFTNDRKWLMDGFMYVNSGATLTVQAGTVVKGNKTTKGSLIIRRGAKLMAEGTASEPIVFTSNEAPGSRDRGDWGGIILCGQAPHNQPSDPTVEGGPEATFGGSNSGDNSGTLRYVRIEFAGIAFQPNQEINGLTLGAVGSGTVIDHVQVSYSGDDSYEWFGGDVNAKYLIAYRGLDDDFDQDFGWRGNVQFALSLRDPDLADASGSNGFECDNDASGNPTAPYSQGTWSNVTILGPMTVSSTFSNLYKRAMHLRRNTQTRVYNSVFAGYPTGLLIDGGSTETNATNGDLQVRNTVLAGMTDNYAVASGSSWDCGGWFGTVGWSNIAYPNNSDLGIAMPVDLSNPALLPNGGSPLLNGSDFTWSPLMNSFFEPVTFRGAFGPVDWTSGWTNWDPQNTVY